MGEKIIPRAAMQRLIALQNRLKEAQREFDEAVALVFAVLEAPPGARIVLNENGEGKVIFEDPPDIESG